MAFELYINTQATNTQRALYPQLTPSMPEFIIGDKRFLNIYFVDGGGQYESFSGSASYDLKIAIGNVGAIPESGTFTLTYGANTTSAIAYDATASTVQTALNALASIISAGGVVVTGTTGGFRVVFNNVGTRTAITGSGENLYPSSSVFSMNAEPGDGSTRSIQLLRIRQTVIAYQDTWTQILDGATPIGWTGEIDTNTVEAALALGDSASVADLEFEVQTTDGSGNVTTWLQTPIVLRNDIIDPSTLTNVNLPDYITAAEANALYLQKANNLSEIAAAGAELAARNNLQVRTRYIPVTPDAESFFEHLIGARFDGINYISECYTTGNVFRILYNATPINPVIRIELWSGLTNGQIIDLNTVTSVLLYEIDATAGHDFANLAITNVGNGGISFTGTGAADTTANLNKITRLSASTTLTAGGNYRYTASGLTTDLMASPQDGETVHFINYSGGSNTIDGNGKNIRSGSGTATATVSILNNEVLKLIFETTGDEWLLVT